MNETSEVERLEMGSGAGTAFATLGNETRIAILRELWDAARDGPTSFSVLRERVGTEDSGGFNYHLTKLCGQFVRKTEEGYVLRTAGAMVVGAVLAGEYESGGFDEPVSTGDPCPDCGGDVALTYEDERARIACLDCDHVVAAASVPPGVFADRDRADAPVLFDRWLRTRLEGVDAGFCLVCQGPVQTRLVPAKDGPSGPEAVPEVGDAHARYECERCGELVLASVPEALVRTPAVVAFYHDHGLDVDAIPTWRLPWLSAPIEVVSTEPLAVGVTVTLDGDSLRLTVDERLEVVAIDGEAVSRPDAPSAD